MAAKDYTSPHRPPVRTYMYRMVDQVVEYLLSPESPDREYPVLINDMCGPLKDTKYILYNVEQCTDGRHCRRVTDTAKKPHIVEVWDYSEENAKLLKVPVPVRHVPFTFQPDYLEKLRKFRTQPPTHDFCFVGSYNPRRTKIVQELQKTHKVLVLRNNYGDDRDKQIARCKVLLNIHYSDHYKIFEVFRCGPWLEIGMPVISESSLDLDPRCIKASYKDIVQTAKELVTQIDHVQTE